MRDQRRRRQSSSQEQQQVATRQFGQPACSSVMARKVACTSLRASCGIKNPAGRSRCPRSLPRCRAREMKIRRLSGCSTRGSSRAGYAARSGWLARRAAGGSGSRAQTQDLRQGLHIPHGIAQRRDAVAVGINANQHGQAMPSQAAGRTCRFGGHLRISHAKQRRGTAALPNAIAHADGSASQAAADGAGVR